MQIARKQAESRLSVMSEVRPLTCRRAAPAGSATEQHT